MVRGTFANIRIKNKMVKEVGGFTKHYPSRFEGEIFEVSKKYKKDSVPLVVVAGRIWYWVIRIGRLGTVTWNKGCYCRKF